MKRKKLIILVALFISNYLVAQNVRIGATATPPNPSSMLELDGINGLLQAKGTLITRVTYNQRMAMNPLPAAAKGLLVYQTDSIEGFYYDTSSTIIPVWIYLSATSNSSCEWTYLTKLIFTNSSAPQNFTSLPPHDQWRLIFNIQNNGIMVTDRLIVSMRLNGISTADYHTDWRRANFVSYTAGGTGFTVVNQVAEKEDFFSGDYILSGKSKTPANIKTIFGNGSNYESDVLMDGKLLGDPADISIINIVPTNPISGSVELWFKDNH